MLPIISAEERLKERHSAKVALVGAAGVGKTSQIKTLPADTTLFVDLEAGDLSVRDWPGTRYARVPGRNSGTWWCFSPGPCRPPPLSRLSRKRTSSMFVPSMAIRHN